MFVELSVSRGKELFNTDGILRVVTASDHARIYLFGVAQPVDISESYEEVRAIVRGDIPND